MTSIAKLKDKARKHEQKEDWQAAIEAYQQVLDEQDGENDSELDLSLYNRIGDLNLRLGETDEAVSFYETAADKYAESGFYNNAIALCNKALRHRPDRPAIYLKLSRLCNEQGFQTDARRWILEYAERQVAAGQVEAALTGLEEFAELSDDPEVRELLAHQLASHDREGEAVEQLRTAYGMRVQAGQAEKAAAVAERARAIDPGVDLESEAPLPAPEPETDELPGLDEPEELEEMEAPAAGAEPEEPAVPEIEPTAAEAVEEAAATEALEGLETRTDTVEAAAEATGLEGLESTAAAAEVEESETEADAISGLEVSYSEQAPPATPEDVEGDSLGGLETFDAGAEPEAPEAESVEAEPAEADAEADFEYGEEEEAEPLPLLDADDEGDDEGEEAEPLPMMDTGFEDMPEEEPGELAATEEAEIGEEAETDLVAEGFETTAEAEAPAEAPAEEIEGGMDLSLGGAETAPPAGEPEPAAAPPSEGAMDLDLGSFDLGFESSEDSAPEVEVEGLDVEATLNRARELVSRGLTSEALRELHLLSGSDAGPDTYRSALAVVNEIIRHDENDISALQRRVEYGAQIGDRQEMVEAYLDLAEALDRLGAQTKSRAMYERALDLDPSNEAAREALGVTDVAEEEETIDLDAVLREMEPEEMEAVNEGRSSDPNFAAMLNQFKAKVTENVEPDDAGDHYDLGLAFKEMGLIDEAIAEFQTALTGGEERLKVYEELGQCFVLKNQYNVALKVFDRALKVPHTDGNELLGVYYHMGQCHEELGQRQEAREAYEKVLAIDETFADVPDRMARL